MTLSSCGSGVAAQFTLIHCDEAKVKKPRCYGASVQANSPQNEDAMSSRISEGNEGHLFGVWDGHGGHQVSAYAARFNLPKVAEALRRYSKVGHALIEGYQSTEQELAALCWEACNKGDWSCATV